MPEPASAGQQSITIDNYQEQFGESQTYFKSTPITLRDHDESAIHHIGAALPVPSLIKGVLSNDGINAASLGTSPIPAREDHVHLTAAYITPPATWTPTWNNLTLGTGATQEWYWSRSGRQATVQGYTKLGTGGKPTGDVTMISTPFPNPVWTAQGMAQYVDDSGSGTLQIWWGPASMTVSGNIYFRLFNQAANNHINTLSLSDVLPFAWTVADTIQCTISYMIA